MFRPGRLFVLCLLLVLLPLRSVLAAGALGCEPLPQPAPQHATQAGHEGHLLHEGHEGLDTSSPAGSEHHAAGKPCKLCAPCCLAAAPPPVMPLGTELTTPAARVAGTPAEAWIGIVPPLPDPPPRG